MDRKSSEPREAETSDFTHVCPEAGRKEATGGWGRPRVDS
jgi:hypothetical protein